MATKLRYCVLLREKYGPGGSLNHSGKWFRKGAFATREEAEAKRKELDRARPTAYVKVVRYPL